MGPMFREFQESIGKEANTGSYNGPGLVCITVQSGCDHGFGSLTDDRLNDIPHDSHVVILASQHSKCWESSGTCWEISEHVGKHLRMLGNI